MTKEKKVVIPTMMVATRINDKYELGYRTVMTIDQEEYDLLKERCRERSHGENHKYIIISIDSGFTIDEINEYRSRIKTYLNPNKIKIDE